MGMTKVMVMEAEFGKTFCKKSGGAVKISAL